MITLGQGRFTVQTFKEERRNWCFRLVPDKSPDDSNPSSPDARQERTLFGGRIRVDENHWIISAPNEFEMRNWIQVQFQYTVNLTFSGHRKCTFWTKTGIDHRDLH